MSSIGKIMDFGSNIKQAVNKFPLDGARNYKLHTAHYTPTTYSLYQQRMITLAVSSLLFDADTLSQLFSEQADEACTAKQSKAHEAQKQHEETHLIFCCSSLSPSQSDISREFSVWREISSRVLK
ncbi:unnamed protein product [Ceratitis capitata]|uniref:(Mediterranean fruit fly) hypothetical protein n=1 Tax=Ceratitis capitata TaxID=7213 RepID=A0A811VJP0_CERCA|nr:unnamed protein product [Ceratitis capitata]